MTICSWGCSALQRYCEDVLQDFARVVVLGSSMRAPESSFRTTAGCIAHCAALGCALLARAETTTYTYDALGRLIKVTGSANLIKRCARRQKPVHGL